MDAVTSIETKQRENRVYRAAVTVQSTSPCSPSLELPVLTLTFTDAVRNLGCYFDRHMQLDRLVSIYFSSTYYHLRLITRIRHLLTRDACHAAIRCLVLSRLDYCNGLLGGLNNGLTNRLQRAQNSAARVINRVSDGEITSHRFCDGCIGCRSR